MERDRPECRQSLRCVLKILKVIGVTLGLAACFYTLGCGTTEVETLAAPSISAVLPQTIAAGSSSVTMKVVGTNFTTNAVILWNGGKLATSMIDANTLSGSIQGGSLALPGTAQVQVQNSQTGQSSQSVPISIISSNTTVPLPLAISVPTIPAGVVGTAYSVTLSATGGTPAYTWSVASGSLPVGMSLDLNTGMISGTPTASGTYSFTVTATDSSSPVQTQSAAISVTVAPAPVAAPQLTISTSALASGTDGSAYSQTLQATGGNPAYTWSVTLGSLPAGLTLAAGTGVISGVPTTSGTFNFTATVTDHSNPVQTKSIPLSIAVASTQLAITTSALVSGTEGAVYSQTLHAAGGTPAYAWTITSGNLPAGLILASGTGVISGTPTTSGTFAFTVTVTDRSNPAQTKSIPLSITISPSQLTITSSALPSGTAAVAYSQALHASGGIPAYIWSITSGSLPAGLSLAAGTGIISGTPTAGGTFTFVATVTDSSQPAQTKSVSLSITITSSQLSITSTALASGLDGTAYSQVLHATGGTPAYRWSITAGSLPTGITLSAGSGVVSGTPTESGTFSFTATVTDTSTPVQTKSVTLSMTIASNQLTITTASLAAASEGTAYSQTLHATGGTPAYSWSISAGSLPTGITLSAGSGVVSGNPTESGTFSFTATVTDTSTPVQTKSVTLSMTIASNQLTITTASLAAASEGTAYSQTLHATGGMPAYSWSITAGSLPTGITLSAGSGVLSGTPSVSGTFTFTAAVTDSGNPVQTQSVAMSITVAPPALAITATALASGTDGTTYSQTLHVSGGTPQYTWAVTLGSLPAGLTLASTTGTISGTPTASGIFGFTVTVTDSGTPAQTKSVVLSITVAPQAAAAGTTWYIRLDGGTNIQCTGTTNAPYPGTGVNQPCAYNHPYQMLTYAGTWASMQGGDTIQFEDQGPYYMGEQNNGLGSDWHSTMGNICPQPNGGNGDACNLPVFPSGTAASPTRIIGANAGSCHNATHTNLVNPTVLEGINDTYQVLNLQGTNHVQISCIEVTQPDTCTRMGTGAGSCTSNNNYVASAGIIFEDYVAQGPSNLTMQDVAVVGISGNGILGSHVNTLSTDVTTMSDIYIIGNGASGWSGDGGGCNNSCESVGAINISYMDVDWNGCVAVEPYNMNVGSEQNAYTDCYDDTNEGYGDGFAQIAAGNMTLTVDHSKFRWNTQDGFDSLHIGDDPTTSPTVKITDSWSEGNEGQTFKLGAGLANTAINNVSIGNCRVLATASNFPLNPAGWNAGVSDFCRAAGDQWALAGRNGTAITLENNTSVGYGATMYDVECTDNCAGGTFIFVNNISKGYPDPGNGNLQASGIYFGNGDPATNPGSLIENNLWASMRTACPDLTNETHAVCSDPLMVGESNINAINPNLTSASPAIGAGLSIGGLSLDFNGISRPNPPAIGALEY
jgi:hypothetical protein